MTNLPIVKHVAHFRTAVLVLDIIRDAIQRVCPLPGQVRDYMCRGGFLYRGGWGQRDSHAVGPGPQNSRVCTEGVIVR